jgi:hypothetical protein
MPPRGHSSATKFNPNIPRELQHYFKELEMLFAIAQIVNNEEKKKHACRYVDIDTADLWESIPEFNVTRTFNEFKMAIFNLSWLQVRAQVDHSGYGQTCWRTTLDGNSRCH